MEISIVGLLVVGCIYLISRYSAEPSLFALCVSFAFGSTAVVTLPGLGGSSPIVNVVFLCGLFITALMRKNVVDDVAAVFGRGMTAWLVLFLVLYVLISAMIMPRLFAGQTTVFVPSRTEGQMGEALLMPAGGNITQGLYFVLGALSFFAASVLLVAGRSLVALRQGFFVWTTLHVCAGFIDLFGKVSGMGDVLKPIRTASYAMLTNVEIAGFYRIAGAYSEASSFGATTVVLLAFMFTYWRAIGSKGALALAGALLSLIVLSTSTTAYVGGGILVAFGFFLIIEAALKDRLQVQDCVVVMAGTAIVVILVGSVLYNSHSLDPLWRLFNDLVLDKASSASAQERAYWNERSLQSLYETVGLGIGIGSSRASSWIIAVLSQLGVLGAMLLALLVFQLWRGRSLRGAWWLNTRARASVLSIRAAALTALVTASIGDGSANPGTLFFLALATVSIAPSVPTATSYRLPRELGYASQAAFSRP